MEIVVIGLMVLLWLQSQSASASMTSGSGGGAAAGGSGSQNTNSISSPVTGTGGMVNPDATYFTGAFSDAIQQASTICGVFPTVLHAIVDHETGIETSSLWLTANNPGGLKYQTSAFYGMNWGYVTADDDAPGEKFGKFPTPGEGVCALGRFLSQSRYSGARQTSSPQGQIQAIGQAGYATDPTWASQVWARYQTIVAQGISPSAGNAGPLASASSTAEVTALATASTSLLGAALKSNTPAVSPDDTPDYTLPAVAAPTASDVGSYSASTGSDTSDNFSFDDTTDNFTL